VKYPVPQPTSITVAPGAGASKLASARYSVSPIQRPRGVRYRASYRWGVNLEHEDLVCPRGPFRELIHAAACRALDEVCVGDAARVEAGAANARCTAARGSVGALAGGFGSAALDR